MWFLEKANLKMLTPTMHLIMSQQDVTDILRLLPQLFNIYHNKNDLV